MKMRHLLLSALLIIFCLAPSAYAIENAPDVIAGGFGVETGYFGLKYARWLDGMPVTVGVGVTAIGVAPQAQYVILERGDWDLYAGGAILLGGNALVLSTDSIITSIGIGVQRWPRAGGFYFNIGPELFHWIGGGPEDGPRSGVTLQLQCGKTF